MEWKSGWRVENLSEDNELQREPIFAHVLTLDYIVTNSVFHEPSFPVS